jgi:hypothetical protein
MKYFALTMTLLLLFLSGCNRGLGPEADKGEADRALRTALEAWKSGKPQDELDKGNPSIIMNEDDWRVGKRLLDFTMEESSLSGRQVRCRVRLKLHEKNDRTTERNAVYIIDTTPRIVIVRDSFAS